MNTGEKRIQKVVGGGETMPASKKEMPGKSNRGGRISPQTPTVFSPL